MAVVLDPRDLTTFGAFLREARERRGITLDQVASTTRIPRRHLDALEHGNLEVIPGGMYRRAEVRAFADAVGLDRNVALAELDQALDHHPILQPPAPSLEAPGRGWTSYLGLALLAAGTLFAATRWLWTPAPQAAPVTAGQTPAVNPAPVATLDAAAARQSPTTPAPSTSRTLTPARSPDEVGTTAPAPVRPDISLVVTSTPDGARVLVDGIGWGRTPIAIRHVTPGTRRVRLVLDGFRSDERLVRVGADRDETNVHVELTPVN